MWYFITTTFYLILQNCCSLTYYCKTNHCFLALAYFVLFLGKFSARTCRPRQYCLCFCLFTWVNSANGSRSATSLFVLCRLRCAVFCGLFVQKHKHVFKVKITTLMTETRKRYAKVWKTQKYAGHNIRAMEASRVSFPAKK